MAQAKGILPKGDDKDVLYKNPQTCGYFIGVTLDPGLDAANAQAWLETVGSAVDALVARLGPEHGDRAGTKVAAVAIGLAPSFFTLNGSARFGSLAAPAAFANPGNRALPNASGPLAAVHLLDWDVLFYVAATYEARVNTFVAALEKTRPVVQEIEMFRGNQREDGTEPFGYADGLRNIRTEERTARVFVHREDRDIDEPEWADGGSYMAFMRILQHADQFAGLADDNARDTVIGRKPDGERLDLVGQNIAPKGEPSTAPELPPGAHVGKVGPRASHDDNQIFRRGLPFLETTDDGQVRVGLNFCSFQATLEQFDVVFNDWAMTAAFPPGQTAAGAVDQLLDPGRGLTTIEHVGFYFVPPYHQEGLAAAVFAETPTHRPAKTGRLIVHKRVVDPSDASKRFERQGFQFQVIDASGNVVPNSQFATNSGGVGLCPADLTVGETYTLQEVASPVENVTLQRIDFPVEGPAVQLSVVNEVTAPNTGYGTTG